MVCWTADIDLLEGSGRSLRAWPSARRCQASDSQQVVGRAGDLGLLLELPAADESRSGQTADRLEPAEDLLDPFANALTDRIALGPFAVSSAASCLGTLIVATNGSTLFTTTEASSPALLTI